MLATARRLTASWCLLVVACCCASAADPEIRALSIRGLQIGVTTTLQLDGEDLGTTPRLLLPFPATQTVKPGATAKQAILDVTLGKDVTPGYYQLRAVTDSGVSLPVVIAVDGLPQRPLTETIETLPVALHGTVSGSTSVETRFRGAAGQSVLVEVEAQRLGSKLRPVLHLLGPQRGQLAWAWTTPALHGDARLEATLPSDGLYTVTVHDAEYAAPAPGYVRLRIGRWSFVDQVFPPILARAHLSVELLGPRQPVRAELPVTPERSFLPLAWPQEGLWSGPRPFVEISDHPQLVAQQPDGKVQELPAGPVGVSGRWRTPFQEDRFRVPVQPGSIVRFEVFSERAGSAVDAALLIRNEAGAELARAQDGPGTLDPVLDFTVPAGVSALLVSVQDSQGRGGLQGLYHLTVDPRQAGATQGSFRAITRDQRATLPVGGRSVVPILIERRGYPGSLEVAADGLPKGITIKGTTIPAEADGTLLTIERGADTLEPALVTWRVRSADGRVKPIVLAGHPLERLQPWLATEFALASSTERGAEFQIDWRGLSDTARLVPSVKLALPVKVTRPERAAVVRLTLTTSQNTPLINNQPDPNQALRQEKPVELAAKATDGALTVLVPPLLKGPVYDVTVEAEFLAADKKTVLAKAFAPVLRLEVQSPLLVQLDGPARIEAKLDPKTGATVALRGRIERHEGFKGEVTLTLAGLPAGAKADPLIVKADATTFTFPITLPANIPPGERKGIKLTGTAVADPKQPNIRIRGTDVDVTLVVAKVMP